MHGYVNNKEKLAKRLRRVQARSRGIQQMIDDDRYCIDVITQVSAATKALQAAYLSSWAVTSARVFGRPLMPADPMPRRRSTRRPRPCLDSSVRDNARP